MIVVPVQVYPCTPEAMAFALKESASSSAHVVVFRHPGKPAVADLLMPSMGFMVLGKPDASWSFVLTGKVAHDIQQEFARNE